MCMSSFMVVWWYGGVLVYARVRYGGSYLKIRIELHRAGAKQIL